MIAYRKHGRATNPDSRPGQVVFPMSCSANLHLQREGGCTSRRRREVLHRSRRTPFRRCQHRANPRIRPTFVFTPFHLTRPLLVQPLLDPLFIAPSAVAFLPGFFFFSGLSLLIPPPPTGKPSPQGMRITRALPNHSSQLRHRRHRSKPLRCSPDQTAPLNLVRCPIKTMSTAITLLV